MDRKGFFKNGFFAALSIAASKVIPSKEVASPISNELDERLKDFYRDNYAEFTKCGMSHGGIKEVYFIPADQFDTFFNK